MINPVIGNRKANPALHGGGIRGDNSAPRSPLFEGKFGRMFRSLPAADWPKEALALLGDKMAAEPELFGANKRLPAAAKETAARLQDDEENSGISAGYTYLGQFIDHDITFDPTSSLQQLNDPDALVDFRTPRLDLDCLYGRGPDDQPYMYSGNKFRLGRELFENNVASHARDLPRFADPSDPSAAQRALIGDKRNDENVIVSQLHSAMLQFHNKIVDLNPAASFREIQRIVRWHYQWIVVNDFLPTICGPDVVQEILPHLTAGGPIWRNPPQLQFYQYRNDPYMPIEFSAAAYRFGHSMVRPIYRLNTQLKGGDNPDQASADEIKQGIAGRLFVFAGVQKRGLNGFDIFPKEWAVDWSLFFDIGGSVANGGTARVQPAYKIDTSLVNPLKFLPEFSNPLSVLRQPMTIDQLQCIPRNPVLDPANLATRNLLRGLAMGLPSGQSVALSMGLDPLEDRYLRIGKAVIEEWDGSPALASIDPAFKEKAPLWCYVLAEAHYEWFQRAHQKGKDGNAEPVRLGAVGGRIVAETLIGLLLGDGHSYLRQAPNWKPDSIRTMGGLLQFALQ